MKRSHKLLIGIAAGSVALAVATCLIVLKLLSQGTLSPEDTAVHYQMALVRGDYWRAYGFLSPALENYPDTVETFTQDLERYDALAPSHLDPCMYVESSRVTGNKAVVVIREQWYNPLCGLMEANNLSFHHFEMTLQREDGEWKVVDSGQHFVSQWAGK